jgi:predicted MFS family arabinose efflux permease
MSLRKASGADLGAVMTSESSARSLEVQATAVATLFSAFTVLPLLLTGALGVLMRAELGFGAGAIGIAASVFIAASATAAIPGGRITAQFGARRAVYVAAVMAATAMAGVAGLARSWPTLTVFLALGGLANGIAQPATNTLIADGVSDRHRGLAFGIKRSSYSVAEILAGLAVPLIGVQLGWRFAWGIAATALVAITVLVPAPPARKPKLEGSSQTKIPTKGPLLRLALAAGFGIGAIGAMQIYFVESAVHRGLGVGTAGALLAAGGAVGIAARMGAGLTLDRRGGDVFLASVLFLGLGAIGYLVMGLGVGLGTAVLGTTLAFGAGQGWTGLYILGVVRMNPESPGPATARIEAGMSTGAVIGPVGVGVLIGAGLFTTAWILGALSLVLAGLFVLVARRSIPRQEPA